MSMRRRAMSVIRDDKRGHIQDSLPKILDRLNLDANSWKPLTLSLRGSFSLGSVLNTLLKRWLNH